MADFITNLWEGVFTPGPTPTLLIATNVTFATLQLVLGGLLLATYSIHFLILSLLSGGLWWAINWFANELKEAQRKEEEAEKLRKKKREDWKDRGEVEDSADDEGGETETEGERLGDSRASLGNWETEADVKNREDILEKVRASGRATQATQESAATGLQVTGGAEARRRQGGSESGELSTDSEWEKVDEDKS